MQRIAFKMKLLAGCAGEYKKRHDEIWPELVLLLKNAGVSDYFIFLDEETDWLFATLKADNIDSFEKIPSDELMQKWRAYMADVMETNTDHSPFAKPLHEVFHLP